MNPISFTVLGPPRTKKNHGRIVKVRGRPIMLPSKQYEEFEKAFVLQVRGRVAGAPLEQPVNCAAVFYRDANRGDAVGYYQALADAMEKAGVVRNDSFIVSWDGSRMDKDAANPRIEITLTALEEQAA